jgi:hypothetical protein
MRGGHARSVVTFTRAEDSKTSSINSPDKNVQQSMSGKAIDQSLYIIKTSLGSPKRGTRKRATGRSNPHVTKSLVYWSMLVDVMNCRPSLTDTARCTNERFDAGLMKAESAVRNDKSADYAVRSLTEVDSVAPNETILDSVPRRFTTIDSVQRNNTKADAAAVRDFQADSETKTGVGPDISTDGH